MKSKFLKRALVAVSVMALTVTGFAFRQAPMLAADDDLTAKWIDVEFTKPMRVKWDWNDLFKDALTAERSINLSVEGMVLSQASELSRARAEAELGKLGFGDLFSDYYLLSTDDKNAISQPARTFGHKKIIKNGSEYHIIAAIFKGTTTIEDAITDAESVKDGFSTAGKNCEESLAAYVKKIEGATKDNTILFITGHSLGASTANEVGLYCDELVNDSAKFVYTYASPNYKTNVGTTKASYNNFIRFTNANDLVPLVPPKSDLLHHGHVGIDVYYNLGGMDAAKKAKFDRVYKYMKGITFEEDTLKIKNHMGDTYMSFILSDLTDAQITEYLTPTPTASATPVPTSAPTSPTAAPTTAPTTTPVPTVSPAPTDDPGAVTPPAVTLKENPIKVTGKTVKVKFGKKATLKKGKVLKIKDAEGTLSFKKKSGNKKITINKKNGKVTVKKGLKKGTYKVKVKVTATGNDVYDKKTVPAVIKIKVK